jgi:glutamate-1-semialdehyde aminotransferase
MGPPHSIEKSMALYKRAEELIPGRTQLISRRASQFASGISPVYAERAKGARFIDEDGHE